MNASDDRPKPELPEVEETYIGRIQRGNDGIKSERGDGPDHPDNANTLPIYPKPEDMP